MLWASVDNGTVQRAVGMNHQMSVHVVVPITVVSRSNVREHWAKRHARDLDHKLAVLGALNKQRKPPGPWGVGLKRYGSRSMDDDNLRGALKAVRDAVAKWLGADDGPSSPIWWGYSQATCPRKNARVEITITWEEQ